MGRVGTPIGVRCQTSWTSWRSWILLDFLEFLSFSFIFWPFPAIFLEFLALGRVYSLFNLGISCFPPFLPKKRTFWSRIRNCPRFFGHFLTKDGGRPSLTPRKTGCDLESGRRGNTPWLSNRQAFQAQLAPRQPKQTQTDPQTDPQEV